MSSTVRQMLEAALTPDDKANPQALICFVRDGEDAPIVQCGWDALPDTAFENGYGGNGGSHPLIAFSAHWVYVTTVYDGFTGIEAVPRAPDGVVGPCLEAGDHPRWCRCDGTRQQARCAA